MRGRLERPRGRPWYRGDHGEALRAPVPERVTVYVYDGRGAFEQGLIRDARVSPIQAAQLSDFAIGVGTRGQVLLNDRPRTAASASGCG